MGEMADDMIDQMLNARFYEEEYVTEEDYEASRQAYFKSEEYQVYRKQTAEDEMEEFNMAKTYKIEINSEKKLYRVKPPEARGSFMARILEPEAFSEGDAKEWGCQLRWPIDNDEVKAWTAEMGGMFKQILVDKMGEKKALELMKNPQLKIPLRNGNHESNDEYEGWLFMNVRNKFRQPIVMGPHAKAIPVDLLNDNIIYSGAWYRSRVVFSYFDVKSKGIGAYIEILMKTRDDDRLDSVINVGAAEEDFSEFASEDAGMDEVAGDANIAAPDAGDGFDFL